MPFPPKIKYHPGVIQTPIPIQCQHIEREKLGKIEAEILTELGVTTNWEIYP